MAYALLACRLHNNLLQSAYCLVYCLLPIAYCLLPMAYCLFPSAYGRVPLLLYHFELHPIMYDVWCTACTTQLHTGRLNRDHVQSLQVGCMGIGDTGQGTTTTGTAHRNNHNGMK